ncbi:MAG: AAA family ATPase [Thainema sp.]
MLTIPGYQITEVIHEGMKSIVCRALEAATHKSVVLKTHRQLYPSLRDIAKLKHQYEILQGVDIEGVVRPYRIEQQDKHLLLVLEDFGGVPIYELTATFQQNIRLFMTVAIEMTQHLKLLHQYGITHKDIKPQNILIHPRNKAVKFIDFGISSRLLMENQEAQNLNLMEGTLAYMSPEQTGRMNRVMDYRSDFYSLGITFYHLLTGLLPFQSSEPLELVHCHIAKQPTSPQVHNPNIPQPLAEIVLKLMAKNAEDRYQSAEGLIFDLQQCLDQLRSVGLGATGKIASFPLGQADFCDRLQISQKLYGRETEVQTLLDAFGRVSEGAIELMLVAGFSGIGKTALIQEVHKPMTRQRGYFITGKFDQLQRNVPYASLIQAFRGLIRQILTEPPQRIGQWRLQLEAALGVNGQVIIDVIPEVERIIGEQPAVPSLGPSEAQNRFNRVFQQFVEVFTRPEHPLVLFLDDLQWADSASLRLIQNLLTSPNGAYLLLIGAYRDNEVYAAHPLMTLLEDLSQAQVNRTDIHLNPLSFTTVQHLLADSLDTTPDQVKDLAEVAIAKTNGNPFFLNQLLNYFYDEQILAFNREQRRWQWDLAQAQAAGITENVIDLMMIKLRRLPMRSQHLLQLAACIGNQFNLKTLAVIAEQSLTEVVANLAEPLRDQVIVQQGNAGQVPTGLTEAELAELIDSTVDGITHRFLHDRVQQAAYELIADAERQAVHLKIGRLLKCDRTSQSDGDFEFEVVNQLNQGMALITDVAERQQLAELNLQAGQKAKSAVAYESAFSYLETGIHLLAEDCWQLQYQLAFNLHKECFECAYLCGNFAQAETLFKVVLEQAKTAIKKAQIYSIQIVLNTTLGKFTEVISLGKEGLRLLGWTVPEGQTAVQRATIAEVLKIKLRLRNRPVAQLVDLPIMDNPIYLSQVYLMAQVIPALYYTDMALSDLFYLRMSSLSLQYGNSAVSAVAYLGLGRFLGEKLKEYQNRYQFGKLALELVERFNTPELKCKTYFLFGGFINHWTNHSREDINHLKTAFRFGIEYGDLIWACYANNVLDMRQILLGIPLEKVAADVQTHLDYAQQVGEQYTPTFFYVTRQMARCLKGQTQSSTSLSDGQFDEEQHVAILQNPGLIGALNWYYIVKSALYFMAGDYEQAAQMADAAEQTIGSAYGLARVVQQVFQSALCLAVRYPSLAGTAQQNAWKRLKQYERQLKEWAHHSPANYQHRYLLVKAEMARLRNRITEAQHCYEQAIQLAQQFGYIQDNAIANERLAQFYTDQGNTVIARAYLMEARHAYLQWGAIAKVADLDAHYPYLKTESAIAPFSSGTASMDQESTTSRYASSSSSSKTGAGLDIYSIIKASQTLSQEILLDKLLEQMMALVIENAGAETGHLLLEHNGEWQVRASGSVAQSNSDQGVHNTEVVNAGLDNTLPVTIINYVTRTEEAVLLHDATQDEQFAHDPYIQTRQPKSVLCLPLIYQGKLISVAYLENNLAVGAFTAERLEVLKILSAQAAISIENARLYTRQVELTDAYSRFVPPEYLAFLDKEITQINLGDNISREMAVMFSDIRAFTTLSEQMSPQENFDFINAYLQQVSPEIRHHHGLIIKYMGDGVMAVFPRKVDDAVRSGIAQLKRVQDYNQQRQAQGLPAIRVGIGLHVGYMMVGIVGEPSRLQADTISDNINLTARLEGLTKFYGVAFLISEQVVDQLDETAPYQMRFVDCVAVKGRNEPISIYEVLDAETADQQQLKLATQADFKHGIQTYRRQSFAEAKAAFEQVLAVNPEDRAAELYCDRIQHLINHGVSDVWDGVWRFTEK